MINKNDYAKLDKITVTTQEELDLIPLDFDGKIFINSKREDCIKVRNHYYFFVKVLGVSTVEAYRNSFVVAQDNSTVISWDSSFVEAYRNSFVVAQDNSTVISWDSSFVVALDKSSVEARDNSTVVAFDNSKVVARDNSTVVTFENSFVWACDNSRVEVNEIDGYYTNFIKSELVNLNNYFKYYDTNELIE